MQQADQFDTSAPDHRETGKFCEPSGLTRRGLVAAMAGAAMLVPPIAAVADAAPSPVMAAIAASRAADARFEALPDDLEEADPDLHRREEDRMLAAFERGCGQVPTDWAEFVALFELMSFDGEWGLDDDRTAALLGHARRLARAA